MSSPEAMLAGRARRAYELGRLRDAALHAWPAPLLTLFALRCCEPTVDTALVGGLLTAAVVALRWRGEAFGRAIAPGLLAGSVPMLLPTLNRLLQPQCASCGPIGWCLAWCVVGGVLAGALVGWRAARPGGGGWRFAASGGLVAALAGSLGCLVAGYLGLAGMAVGFVLGGAPALVLAPRMR
jgi:hypothetical protein